MSGYNFAQFNRSRRGSHMIFILDDAIRGLIGGLLIGCAAALLLLGNGRIAGISGIAAVFTGGDDRKPALEKLIFLVGLIAAPLLYALAVAKPEIGMTSNPALLIGAGLMVGLGTRLGNGCTSGHGVCGISRLSARSIIATLTFMITAAVTVYVVRHLVGV